MAQEPSFDQPEEGVYGFVVDPCEKIDWQAADALTPTGTEESALNYGDTDFDVSYGCSLFSTEDDYHFFFEVEASLFDSPEEATEAYESEYESLNTKKRLGENDDMPKEWAAGKTITIAGTSDDKVRLYGLAQDSNVVFNLRTDVSYFNPDDREDVMGETRTAIETAADTLREALDT